MKIPLSRPDITDRERKAVNDVLNTPYLSLGPKLPEFEEKLAQYAGVKYATAVNSGTSALHLVLRSMDLSGGAEVITTPFSFISSANCLLFEGFKPVFTDIEPVTMNLNVSLLEENITEKTEAILGVDVFGHPAEWEDLRSLGQKNGLRLIEDSCEAIGSEYKGIKAGSLAEAGTFAFYPNKQITTGEGGAVVTDDQGLDEICKSLRNQGRGKGASWFGHERLGYNYRISDINCALGIAQLDRIDEILEKRERVAEMYSGELNGIEELELPVIRDHVKISWFVYVIRLGKEFPSSARDSIVTGLNEAGIECGKYFSPIHLQPFYRRIFGYKEGDFPVAESVASRTIALPFFNDLSEEDIVSVAGELKKQITRVKKEEKIGC